MVGSLYEAFEKDRLRREHFEHRCNFDECPYCHTEQKKHSELTSEMIEVSDDTPTEAL